jgi:hypothetical protein
LWLLAAVEKNEVMHDQPRFSFEERKAEGQGKSPPKFKRSDFAAVKKGVGRAARAAAAGEFLYQISCSHLI